MEISNLYNKDFKGNDHKNVQKNFGEDQMNTVRSQTFSNRVRKYKVDPNR